MSTHSVEVRAASIADAVAAALAQLGKDEDEALIEVLDQTSESVMVRVSVPEDEPEFDDEPPATASRRQRREDTDLVAESRSVLEGLLQRMQIEAFVTPVVRDGEGPHGEPERHCTLHIEGLDEETTGLMIGRRGETLRSLQYLVNLMVHRRIGFWPQLVIDVGQYRQRRQDSLEGLAHRMADRVRQTGRAVPLEPMTAYERRIIHMALRGDSTVYTESTGEGETRKIVIFPVK